MCLITDDAKALETASEKWKSELAYQRIHYYQHKRL